MSLTLDKVNVDLTCFEDYITSNEYDTRKEFFGIPGQQHYRLLAYLSTLHNNSTIIDIGTHRGSSALALSYNSNNKVISFDICDKVDNPKIKNRSNIEFRLTNLFTSLDEH